MPIESVRFWNALRGELHGIEALNFVNEHLREVRVDANNWETEYVDDSTGETWIKDYPPSGHHGGGSPRLRKLTTREAV